MNHPICTYTNKVHIHHVASLSVDLEDGEVGVGDGAALRDDLQTRARGGSTADFTARTNCLGVSIKAHSIYF